MYACAMAILRNYHDAQDAVQDAFYNITATYYLFEKTKESSTAALVHIYVKNSALNIYNKNKRHSRIFVDSENIEDVQNGVADEDENLQKIVIDNETIEIVSTAIEKLESHYKDAIVLKYYYSMRNADIARVLNIGPKQVNGLLFRAKKKLKVLLGKEGYDRITK